MGGGVKNTKTFVTSFLDDPFIMFPKFSWISSNGASDKFSKEKVFPGTEITIRFSRHDPFTKSDEKKGKLVVALYAWDGNSFPGKYVF